MNGNVKTTTSQQRDLVALVDVPDRRPWTTVRWLRRAVYEHRIPYHKVGGKVLIDLADLDTMTEAGRVQAEGSA